MEAIIFAVSSFVSTLIGGLFGIRNRQRLHLIISFTAGVLLAVVFFDIMPEIFDMVNQHSLSITAPMVMVVMGFLVVFFLEKIALIHSAHEDEYVTHRHPAVGLVGAGGLIFHSLLDGVGIGLGFQVSPHVGLLVAIAVIAHDFSDGLNTVSLLLLNKHTVKKASSFLVADALAPILGVVLTYAIAIPERVLPLYLGFFAGFLLYIGASDLLPEAHSKQSSYRLLGLTLAGVLFIFFITRFV
jgi:ZIP family zinc transporter